jgi:START domain
MKFRSLFISFIWLLLQISAKCQNWTLKKDKDGIKVFTRKTTFFKFDELKVECEIDASLSAMAAVLLDVNHHGEWVYKTAKSQLLKSSAATDLFFYTEIECPWPFENRDVVVHLNLTQNAENRVMTVIAQSTDGYLPDKKNIVRMKYSRVTWMVTPLNNRHLKVDYRVQIDPGGSVPAWLLNAFASKGPFESFTKLKAEIKLPQYAHAKFAFLTD